MVYPLDDFLVRAGLDVGEFLFYTLFISLVRGALPIGSLLLTIFL